MDLQCVQYSCSLYLAAGHLHEMCHERRPRPVAVCLGASRERRAQLEVLHCVPCKWPVLLANENSTCEAHRKGTDGAAVAIAARGLSAAALRCINGAHRRVQDGGASSGAETARIPHERQEGGACGTSSVRGQGELRFSNAGCAKSCGEMCSGRAGSLYPRAITARGSKRRPHERTASSNGSGSRFRARARRYAPR